MITVYPFEKDDVKEDILGFFVKVAVSSTQESAESDEERFEGITFFSFVTNMDTFFLSRFDGMLGLNPCPRGMEDYSFAAALTKDDAISPLSG